MILLLDIMNDETEWADSLLLGMSEVDLAEFLIGNADPTANVIINCSSHLLHKAFRAVAASVHLPYADELAEDIIDNAVFAVQSRVKREGDVSIVAAAVLKALLNK